MANHSVHLEDLIEVSMAVENDRPLAPWAATRLLPIINTLAAGDTITVLPGLEGEDHYAIRER